MVFTPINYAPPKADQQYFDCAIGILARKDGKLRKDAGESVTDLGTCLRVEWVTDDVYFQVDLTHKLAGLSVQRIENI